MKFTCRGLVICLVFVIILSCYSSSAVAKKTTFYTISQKSSEEIIKYAIKQKSVKYKYGGSTPDGFDSSGYIYHIFTKNGIMIPRTVGELSTIGNSVDSKNLLPGDLLFFNTTNNSKKNVNFVGIYTGNNHFYASTLNYGVKDLKLNDKYWSKRLVKAKRIFTVKLEKKSSFSLKDIKVGNYISGMKVDSILVPNKEYINSLPTRILFKGRVSLKGRFTINSTGDYSFTVEKESLRRLPTLKDKNWHSIIQFEDQNATKEILSKNQVEREVTMIIDNYRLHYVGTDFWATAEIIDILN